MDASAALTPQTKKPITSEAGLHSPSALTVGAKLNEFVITGIIGEGGFGIVYSANDTLLQRNVAIKEYMPAAIANRLASSKINLRSLRHQQTFAAGMQGFIDEARLLAQFKHSALVEILRFWEANGTAYMVMPHYSGKTLRNILRSSRNLCSERWLKSILGPVLDAIELLHSNHVYHRDIAPDNIVIQDNGQPVLLDLGSARRVIAGMQSALTVVVKPGYAPIEQYTEDTANEQGPWTDIYALGAVLYFAISGSAPTASVSRMMRDSLKPLNVEDHPLYSDNFLSSVNKALQLRPCDRYQCIADFRDALNINTSLTGNIALDALSSEEAPPQETPIGDQYKDDEITLILSEDEISVFKEKLLQSLHSPVASTHQHQNENVLSNEPPTKETSISSFADVKDLLEDKNYAPNHRHLQQNSEASKAVKTAESAQQEKIALNQKKFAFVNRSPIKLPIVVGISVLVSIILVTVFTVTSNDDDVRPISENQNSPRETAPQLPDTGAPTVGGDVAQDNIHVPSYAHNIEAVTTVSGTQPSAGNIFSVAPSTNDISQTERQVIPEQTPASSDQQAETLSEPLPAQSNQPPSEAENGLIAAIAQEKSSDSKKPASKTITSNATAVAREPHITEMGSAKLTLVPWGEIWVDNQRLGVSPPLREVVLAPGRYIIELRNPGLPTETRTLTFGKGENPAIYHDFSAAKQIANATSNSNGEKEDPKEPKADNIKQDTSKTDVKEQAKPIAVSETEAKPAITSERLLSFKILPWGEIFLNGEMVGVTPPLRDLKLAPGEHLIEIRHPSYPTKTIQITPDDPVAARIEHNFQ